MSAIWAILLDTSSSMDEDFSAKSPSVDPLAEVGLWQKKLDAAKQLLHRQVKALRHQNIMIVRFSDSAAKVFFGDQSKYDPSVVDSLTSSGHTSIASALDLLTSDPELSDYDSISVLVLTDGLANEGDAPASAQKFILKHPNARVDTILIDPTDEGNEVAQAISINGIVRPAYSTVDLTKAVGSQRRVSLISAVSDLSMNRLALEYDLALATGSPTPITLPLVSARTITTNTLATQVLPAVNAIQSLQSVASEIRGEPYTGRIISISVGSAPKITMSGVRDAIEALLEIVIPWKRHHAKILKELELQSKRIEVAREEAEYERFMMENDWSDREKSRQDELAELEHEHRRMQMKFELAQFEAANRILDRFARKRDLTPHESQVLRKRVVLIISDMAANPIEFGDPIDPEKNHHQQGSKRRRRPRP